MGNRAWLVPVIGGMAILLAPGGPAAARSPQQGSAAVVRGHADIGTAKLYYEVRGSGRPLVLLHGGLSSSEDFEAVIPELSRSFRVISIDRRGHGRSPDTEAPFTYEGMADDIGAVLNVLRVGAAAVVGFSDGGVVGYHLASKYPTLVTHLVSVGANSRVDGLTPDALEWARTRLTVEGLARDVPDVEKRFRTLNPTPGAFPRFVEKSRALWLRDPYITPDAMARIAAPVLFVLGEQDAVTLDHVLEMRARVQQGHLCVLPNASHFVLKEKPDVILPILLDFLQIARPRAATHTPVPVDADTLFRGVADAMPDYADFLTVDELQQGLTVLQAKYPDVVRLRTVGTSAAGFPITECQIGHGKRHALLFGFPHPNEPIGSMMLRYLTEALASNAALRGHFDFTWHIVLCADPDKARLNEGWFKGTNSVTKYARHYYRPPSYQQVEWTFPVTYRKYAFTVPSPEAKALMTIIDAQRIDFSFGLHNSGFGGVYYYWSHDVPALYPTLYGHIARLGLPLHLGEPEAPWGRKFDDKAMFRMIYFTDEYDYLEKYSPTPPEQLLKSGASSDDYVRERYQTLTVNCELPYFFDPRIEDTRPSDLTRREAIVKSIGEQRARIADLRQRFTRVEPLLTAGSPFVDAIRETLRTADSSMAAEEKIAGTDATYARVATVAEKWDALTLRRFHALLTAGQFVRLLETERARTGSRFPAALATELSAALANFEDRARALEAELNYSIVPIRKLATVQLLTALYAMDHVQKP